MRSSVAIVVIGALGTFHALDGRSQWFGKQVRDAFEQSNELVLETLVPEQPQPGPLVPPLRAPSDRDRTVRAPRCPSSRA